MRALRPQLSPSEGKETSGSQPRYLRAILTLASGQIVASIIPLVAAPVLGRLYLPEDYGVLAAYTVIVTVATSVVNLHYQHGVLIEKSDRRAHQVAFLALGASAGVSLVMIPVTVALFLLDPFTSVTGGQRLCFFFLPLSTMIIGTSVVAQSVSNRAQDYRILAIMQFSTSAASAFSAIAFGLAGLNFDGLFLAYLFSQAITFGFSVAIILRHRVLECGASLAEIRTLAIRHRGYPLFTLPSSLIRVQTDKIPEFMLIGMGASEALGSYVRGMQLISMPTTIITAAVSRVYFRRASELYYKHGNCSYLLRRTTLGMLLLGAAPFFLIWLYSEQLFTFYLGENWHSAGTIARILVPMLYLQFALQPVNSVFQFAGKQRYGLGLNIMYLLLVASGIAVAILFNGESIAVIQGFVGGASLTMMLQFLFAVKLSRGIYHR